MYARITRYKLKPESMETARAMLPEMKERIMGLPGTLNFINAANDDGSGYVIAVVESKEVSDANQEAVMAIWAVFGEHLEAVPSPEGFDVIANWQN